MFQTTRSHFAAHCKKADFHPDVTFRDGKPVSQCGSDLPGDFTNTVEFSSPRQQSAQISILAVTHISVQNGIYALGKVHMRTTLSLSSYSNIDFETVPMFIGVTMALPRSVKDWRSSSASAFYASLLQTVDGVVFLALCPQVVSQVPQYCRSS